VHRRRHGHRHVRRPRLIPSFRHTYRMRAATAARFVWQAPPGAGRNPRVSAGMVRSDGRLSENGGNKWTAASRTVLGQAARVSSSAAQPGGPRACPRAARVGCRQDCCGLRVPWIFRGPLAVAGAARVVRLRDRGRRRRRRPEAPRIRLRTRQARFREESCGLRVRSVPVRARRRARAAQAGEPALRIMWPRPGAP
jgi:hypothetical protein